MESPLQVSQQLAGTHCESGPDATPICREMLSSLLPLTPAGFTSEQGLSEGLNEVQRLTGTTPESSNPDAPSNEWGYANSISVLLAPSRSIARLGFDRVPEGPLAPQGLRGCIVQKKSSRGSIE